eukprot:2326762-Pleurochrysis_carterae.AAC.4
MLHTANSLKYFPFPLSLEKREIRFSVARDALLWRDFLTRPPGPVPALIPPHLSAHLLRPNWRGNERGERGEDENGCWPPSDPAQV